MPFKNWECYCTYRSSAVWSNLPPPLLEKYLMIMLSRDRDVGESTCAGRFPWWVKSGGKHTSQTVDCSFSPVDNWRSERVVNSGARSTGIPWWQRLCWVVLKRPFTFIKCAIDPLSLGGSWPVEVCFHFVPVNKVNNLWKKQTEACLLTFQKKPFCRRFWKAVCNGFYHYILLNKHSSSIWEIH